MSNFQLRDSQKVPYAVAEFDAKGVLDAPGAGDSVALTTDSSSSLSIVPDATVDPAKVPNNADGTPGNPANYLQTGFIVGGSSPKSGCQVVATFAHADGTPAPPPVVDLIDVVAGPIVSGGISLGTPVDQ
jgi:hypothetical protein